MAFKLFGNKAAALETPGSDTSTIIDTGAAVAAAKAKAKPKADSAPAASRTIAERLRNRMAALTVPYMDTSIHFTVSIGVADLLLDTDNPLESMMKRADMALYRAKNAGRNRVCLADNLLESMPVA